MITASTKWIFAVSFALAAAGFLLPFWPLTVLGILLCALSGHWILAFLVGLLLDVAYGAPIGRWHFLYFPFTIAAVLSALARYGFDTYVRKGPTQTL